MDGQHRQQEIGTEYQRPAIHTRPSPGTKGILDQERQIYGRQLRYCRLASYRKGHAQFPHHQTAPCGQTYIWMVLSRQDGETLEPATN
jgi:hypothetical protein